MVQISCQNSPPSVKISTDFSEIHDMKGLAYLTALKELQIGGNRIQNVSSDIIQCQSLEVIMSDYALTKITHRRRSSISQEIKFKMLPIWNRWRDCQD